MTGWMTDPLKTCVIYPHKPKGSFSELAEEH